jgi:hypothetical protein
MSFPSVLFTMMVTVSGLPKLGWSLYVWTKGCEDGKRSENIVFTSTLITPTAKKSVIAKPIRSETNGFFKTRCASLFLIVFIYSPWPECKTQLKVNQRLMFIIDKQHVNHSFGDSSSSENLANSKFAFAVSITWVPFDHLCRTCGPTLEGGFAVSAWWLPRVLS